MMPSWFFLLLAATVYLVVQQVIMNLGRRHSLRWIQVYYGIAGFQGAVLSGIIVFLLDLPLPLVGSAGLLLLSVGGMVAVSYLAVRSRKIDYDQWGLAMSGDSGAGRLHKGLLAGAISFTLLLCLIYGGFRLIPVAFPPKLSLPFASPSAYWALTKASWGALALVALAAGFSAFQSGARAPSLNGFWVSIPAIPISVVSPEMARYLAAPLARYGVSLVGSPTEQMVFFITGILATFLLSICGGWFGARSRAL